MVVFALVWKLYSRLGACGLSSTCATTTLQTTPSSVRVGAADIERRCSYSGCLGGGLTVQLLKRRFVKVAAVPPV